eukprot:TRINITY_DN2819_c0_g2_i1.p1 TRINITY_DN2819_c0_g2~~TRINITY_DN2819_c0_g2_i1.p1  ORF type:complete len:233 (+),score=26.44 TRINITY_DN2819_c0_g2_i1:117-815(+)
MQYMVIDNDQLAYYPNTTEPVPSGGFSLIGCVCGPAAQIIAEKPMVFYIDHPAGRRYLFQAFSPADYKDWNRQILMTASPGPELDKLNFPNQASGTPSATSVTLFRQSLIAKNYAKDAIRKDSNLVVDSFDRQDRSDMIQLAALQSGVTQPKHKLTYNMYVLRLCVFVCVSSLSSPHSHHTFTFQHSGSCPSHVGIDKTSRSSRRFRTRSVWSVGKTRTKRFACLENTILCD